jgi:hypothetical protein
VSVWSNVVTAAATLGGVAITAYSNARNVRAQHRAKIQRESVDAALDAAAELISAVDAHRAAMWKLEDLRITGAETVRVDDAQAVSHGTRAAITRPQVRLFVLVPDLTDAVNAAVQATFAMRDSTDLAELETRRTAAHQARGRLITACQAAFAAHGVSLPAATETDTKRKAKAAETARTD